MLQTLQLLVAAEQYKLPEIRDNFSLMICSSLIYIVLMKYIQVGIDITETYQLPYFFTTVFESGVNLVIRTNYTNKTAV